MATLVVITSSYPLGGVTDPAFVGPEAEMLCREFDRVIFAPILDCGEQLPLPTGAELSRALIGRMSLTKRLKRLVAPSVWRHLWADRQSLTSLRRVRASIATSVYALHYRDIIARMGLDFDDTIIYSFWFTAPVNGAALLPGAKIVTRAHGFDIYNRSDTFHSPSQRQEALSKLLKVYVASEDGAEYLRSRFPGYESTIEVARMGSQPPSGLNPDTPPCGEVTLLSIARVVPVKRIPLMASLLVNFARLHPELSLRWIHIGDGEELDSVKELCSRECPGNLAIEFLGRRSNEEVHRLLATRHIDAVFLTSKSEGLPISLCESLSYGVPAIATAVGGIPEIITPEVGALLSPDPTPEEFESVFLAELPRLAAKRTAARDRWERHFDATKLRSDFARKLRAFLKCTKP